MSRSGVGARLINVRRVSQLWAPLDPVGGWVNATVTANASAHTKGAWTELIASTAAEADALDIDVGGVSQSGVNTAVLLDIGVGAAASESVIIPDVAVGSAAFLVNSRLGISFRVPVKVPRGSRIAARIQSIVTGGKTASVSVRPVFSANPVPMGTTVDVIGTDTSTSQAAATSGTVGTWTEIGTTVRPYDALVFVPSMASAGVIQAERPMFLGVGPSGAEVAIHSRISAVVGVTENFRLCDGPAGAVVQRYIPPGTRLAVKVTGLANSGIQACVLGIGRLP